MSQEKKNLSMGSWLIPASFHQRLQFERFYIHEFIRREGISRMSQGLRVLDAGSGRIAEQHLREEILSSGADLTTLDLFEGEGVDVAGDVAEMPFGDSHFDVVLCTQVLEHVPDPKAVCQELFRVVRPGGAALVTAPQSAWLHNLPYHFFHYTNIGLRKILEDEGFEVELVEPQGGHFVNLATHLHYTVRVVKHCLSGKPAILRFCAEPFLLAWRVVFGLGFKCFALLLDQWMPFEGNTQGWNLLAIRESDINNGINFESRGKQK